MYKTLEELQKDFPAELLNKRLALTSSTKPTIKNYYNDYDLKILEQTFEKVQIINERTARCYYNEEVRTINGYLFNGKEWMIVDDTWDGYFPFSEADTLRISKIIKEKSFRVLADD